MSHTCHPRCAPRARTLATFTLRHEAAMNIAHDCRCPAIDAELQSRRCCELAQAESFLSDASTCPVHGTRESGDHPCERCRAVVSANAKLCWGCESRVSAEEELSYADRQLALERIAKMERGS